MTRLPILLSAVLLCDFASSRPLPALSAVIANLKASVDSLVARRVAEDSFSGVVIVASKGQIVYERAAGVANREHGIPMTLDTKLQIASATKLYTQIAIRQLEQLGKLSLADTVGTFLPEYPNRTVRAKVTVEQLLRHRSGVGSFWNERFMARRASVRTVRDYMELFQNDSLLFEPGTSEAYSNGGYVLLGAIIERLSGQTYHDYVRKHIFEPAGMTETLPYDSRAAAPNSALGYTFQSLGGSPTGGRRPNAAFHAGMSGPAGDHYSTAGDFIKLARALTSHRLLDSTRTAAVLGQRFAAGGDFRANGGGPGVNAEFSIFPSGDVMVVLSNYDPPAATVIAQFIRSLLGATPAQNSLRTEIDSLHATMIAAFKRDPASVAPFYTDDAKIIGMGMNRSGRAQVDQYWSQGMGASDWILEVVEVGGTREAPWVLGRSTIVGTGGRRMATDYMAVLARGSDGRLRYRIDLFTPGQSRQSEPVPARVPAQVPDRGPAQSDRAPTVSLSRPTDIPLEKIGNFYYVNVAVNGRPFRFTLETGANFFAVSSRLARALQLNVDSAAGESRAGGTVHIDALTIGGARLTNLTAAVTTLFESSPDTFDGIISIPVLREFLATIDLPRRVLRLERGALPAANGRDILAIAGKDRGGRVDVMLDLGGSSTAAVLDTRSFIGLSLPDSLEPRLSFVDSVRSMGQARGPSLGTFTLRRGQLISALRLGGFEAPKPVVIFRDRGGSVIGVPILEQFVITLDIANGRLRFTRPDGSTTFTVPEPVALQRRVRTPPG